MEMELNNERLLIFLSNINYCFEFTKIQCLEYIFVYWGVLCRACVAIVQILCGYYQPITHCLPFFVFIVGRNLFWGNSIHNVLRCLLLLVTVEGHFCLYFFCIDSNLSCKPEVEVDQVPLQSTVLLLVVDSSVSFVKVARLIRDALRISRVKMGNQNHSLRTAYLYSSFLGFLVSYFDIDFYS